MHYLMTGCYPGETELKGKLSCIIDKCVRFSKEERYQTVEELIRDLTKGFEEPKKEMSTKKGNIFTRSLYRYKKSKGVIYYEVLSFFITAFFVRLCRHFMKKWI